METEAINLGLENIIKFGQKYYLKPKLKSGFSACTFLDEEKGECTIYDLRPTTCRIYDCSGDNRIDLMFQEVMYLLKKKDKNSNQKY